MAKPVYKRVLLKISGDADFGDDCSQPSAATPS